MKKVVKLHWFPFFALFAIVFATIGGWIANIVKIFGMSFDPLTAEAVLRVIGVFVFPIGGIMGYL